MKNLFLLLCVLGLAGCTLNCQNISTEGTASDLGDAALTDTPTVSPTVSVAPKP